RGRQRRGATTPACPAAAGAVVGTGRGDLDALLADGHGDRGGEARGGHAPEPATQGLAVELPALVAVGQFLVVLQPAQQEARLVGRQGANDEGRQLLAVVEFQPVDAGGVVAGVGILAHGLFRSRVALWTSSSGRSSASIASRARKMRERTVPIGQSIFCAISS